MIWPNFDTIENWCCTAKFHLPICTIFLIEDNSVCTADLSLIFKQRETHQYKENFIISISTISCQSSTRKSHSDCCAQESPSSQMCQRILLHTDNVFLLPVWLPFQLETKKPEADLCGRDRLEQTPLTWFPSTLLLQHLSKNVRFLYPTHSTICFTKGSPWHQNFS